MYGILCSATEYLPTEFSYILDHNSYTWCRCLLIDVIRMMNSYFLLSLLLMTVATITVMTGSWCWIAITIMAFLLFQCTICQTCIIILESASISGENCIANQYFSWLWKLFLKARQNGISWDFLVSREVAKHAKPCFLRVTISNSTQI